MKIVTIASLKGGCGKTSTALFLAEALAHTGHRVILIDADPNNNATDYLARDETPEAIEARSLYHALAGRRELADCIISSSFGLGLIPGTPSLASASIELSSDPGVSLRFPMDVKALDADFVIIDTTPALTLEMRLAVYAADVVLVPVGLSRWTLQGYEIIANEVLKAERSTGRNRELLALPSIVTEREAAQLRAIPKWKSTETAILKLAAIRNATNAAKPLKANTGAWEMFWKLAEEVAI